MRVLDHKSEDRLIGEGILDVDRFVESGPETSVSLESGTGKLIVKKTTPLKFKLSARYSIHYPFNIKTALIIQMCGMW